MYSELLDKLEPHQLSKLLELESLAAWTSQDSQTALEQVLDQVMLDELAAVPIMGNDVSNWINLLKSRGVSPDLTFREFFNSGAAPLEVIRAIQGAAKIWRNNRDHPLHDGPAMVLYYAAIAKALVSCQAWITRLPREAVMLGCQRACSEPGSATIHPLFQKAIKILGSPGAGSPR